MKHIGQAAPKTGSRNRSKSEAVRTGLPSCWTCAACNLPSCVAQDRKVEVVARTLRLQLRRSAGGARLFAKCSAKRPPFWGPERGPEKGGRRSCSLSFLRTGAGGARFWGRFLDPKMGAAFCVKNIAEAECATCEPISARKRACPKLLVVGRSLCSALVPKSWPSADRGGPSRGFGFCYRLWTSFWGAESGSSFGRRQVACSLGVGFRARTPQVGRTGWLVGWLVGC